MTGPARTATSEEGSVQPALADAYIHCLRLARAHYENFPVASLFLPAHMRPHVAAVYAFARIADDLADEGDASAHERLSRLEAWRSALHAVLERGADVEGRTLGGDPMDPSTAHRPDQLQILRALAHTVRTHALPVQLFDDLVSAFSQDVHVHRYATWDEVFDYCRRSANPVGRLVLRLAGHANPQADEWSDRVCTALQLTNFWQDFAIDWRRGRLYLPLEEVERAGADVRDLNGRALSPPWRQAVSRAVDRTAKLFDDGRPVCDVVSGRLGWELRATWIGGTRILEKVRAVDCDVLRTRPTIGARDLPVIVGRLLGWRRRGAGRAIE